VSQKATDESLEVVNDLAADDDAARTADVSVRFDTAPTSVIEGPWRLARKAMTRYEPPERMSLAHREVPVARKLGRNHGILEVALDRVLGIDCGILHGEARKSEHAPSDETETTLYRMLGEPTGRPHGNTVLPSESEVESGADSPSKESPVSESGGRRGRVIPLTALAPKRKARIASIRGGMGVVGRLSDLGLTPGTVVSVVRAAPLHGPVEISVRGCNLVIGRGIAQKIFVEDAL
jgi:DtxR family Mn-dependent transcriptional regulator